MKLTLFFITVVLLFIVACSTSLRAFSDSDKDADISAYKSYSWLSEKEIKAKGLNPIYYNELNDKRIKRCINEQLGAKGFELMEGIQLLQLHYHNIIEDKTLLPTEPGGFSYSSYWRSIKITAYPYKHRTLIINLNGT